jgi:hypothetical protein
MALGGASNKAWLPLFPILSIIVLLVVLITTVAKPTCVESNTGMGPEIPCVCEGAARASPRATPPAVPNGEPTTSVSAPVCVLI